METREIEVRRISDLLPRANNPRTHSQRQIGQIAKSIERFGFVTPILVDAEGKIIAGHGRLEAAKHIGMEEVPTLRVAMYVSSREDTETIHRLSGCNRSVYGGMNTLALG